MPRRLSLLLLVILVTACAPIQAVTPTNVPNPTPVAAQPTAAAPAPTGAPTASTTGAAEPTASAVTPAGQSFDELAALEAAEPAPRDQTVLAEAFKGAGDLPEVARTTPLEVQVGDVQTFWVSDSLNDTNYEVEARLRYAGPVVLMYVDTSIENDVEQADIEEAAQTFEREIYPRNREIFGSEDIPGIDGDPRLTVLNTPVRGAGGYFSSSDGVTKQVNRFSNERDMFVIGVDSYPIGTEGYLSTLAHEFQHMIEWHVARRSPSWFNEGMSSLAEDLNGYVEELGTLSHIADPDIQLTTWASDSAQTGQHYGTSRLFMRYIHEQFGGDATVGELIEADAGNNLEAFVPIAQRVHPDVTNFADIVGAWAVANLINDPNIGDGRYAYELLPDTVTPEPVEGSGSTSVNQFGADYLELPQGPAALRFDGTEAVELVGALPESGRYAWWSNRGDDGVQTLTRQFDLTGVDRASLQFSAWHEIELDWDYGFVSVSTDNGASWVTIEGSTTTNSDPQGQNFGNGLTGVSGSPGEEPDKGVRGEWIDEEMDLTPYAGQSILLRFWMVNDAAYNAAGMLIDDIRIPEIDYADGVEDGDGGWEAVGFVRTDGELPQEWTLQLVREGPNGLSVERVPTDTRGQAGVVLREGERGILVVMPSTPFTTEPASYSYAVETR